MAQTRRDRDDGDILATEQSFQASPDKISIHRWDLN